MGCLGLKDGEGLSQVYKRKRAVHSGNGTSKGLEPEIAQSA